MAEQDIVEVKGVGQRLLHAKHLGDCHPRFDPDSDHNGDNDECQTGQRAGQLPKKKTRGFIAHLSQFRFLICKTPRISYLR